MEVFGLLAPIAFVFGLAAISQGSSLKKEVEKLKDRIEEMEERLSH